MKNIYKILKALISQLMIAKNFLKICFKKTFIRVFDKNELFKLQLKIKGSVVECGVHQGGELLWHGQTFFNL